MPQVRAQSYLFDSYTTSEGLASNFVYAIHQDSLGSLYVATRHGINTIRGGEVQTLPVLESVWEPQPTYQITSDRRHLYFNGREVWQYTLGEENSLKKLGLPPNSFLWTQPGTTPLVFSTERVPGYLTVLMPKRTQITKVIDWAGDLYVMASNGLFRYSTHTKRLDTLATGGLYSGGAVVGQDLHLFSSEGLLQIDRQGEVTKGPLPDEGLLDAIGVEDPWGRLWRGGYYAGISWRSDGQRAFLDERDGFPGTKTLDILKDYEGSLWFCTEGRGLWKLSNYFLRPKQPPIQEWPVSTLSDILQDGEYTYFGFDPGGVHVTNAEGRLVAQHFSPNGLSPDYIRFLKKLPTGPVVAGTHWHLNLLNKGKTEVIFAADTSSGYLRGFVPDANVGQGFLLTQKRLYLLQEDMRVQLLTKAPAEQEFISIIADDQGNLYVASQDLLYIWSEGKLIPWNELPSRSTFLNKVNQHWYAGTRDGTLYRVGPGGYVPVLSLPGKEPIYNLLSTDTATFLFSQRNLYLVDLNTGSVQRVADYYGYELYGSNVLVQDGMFWLPTSSGLLILDPSKVSVDQVSPRGYLVGDAISTNQETTVSMPHDTAFLALSVVANVYRGAHQWEVQIFKDHELVSSTHNAQVVVPMVEGLQQVRVDLVDASGNRTTLLDQAYRVPVLFWKTAWFKAVVLVILVLVGIGLRNTLRVMKIKKEQKLQRIQNAQIARVREEIAMDFHDEIGNRVASLNMLTDLLRRKLRKQEDPEPVLHQMVQYKNDIFHWTRDFLWAMDGQSNNLQAVYLKAKDHGERFFQQGPFTFKTELMLQEESGLDLPLPQGAARDILQIVKECFTNISKHSEGNTVVLVLRRYWEGFTLEVQDNGCGAGFSTAKGGKGLKNMMKRARRAGLNIQWEDDSGRKTVRLQTN